MTALTLALAALAESADSGADLTMVLEVARWLVAPGVSLWVLRAILGLRDDVRDVKRDVSGVDGTNGLKSTVRSMGARLEELEDRQLAIDAIEEHEREQYTGPEKRHRARRFRDLIREERERPSKEKP